jgi:hypothetical protein
MFAALAFAGAVAPPKISLSLEGMTSAYKLKESIVREHDLDYRQNNGARVMSRQDWTEKCPALRKCADGKTCTSDSDSDWVYTSEKNCPFPVAKGYDHQDKQVDVKTRVFLVDVDGQVPSKGGIVQTSTAKIQWGKRSTYLFKYDASDTAGNHAEQVVFALILNDDEAPFFQETCQDGVTTFMPAITVEAAAKNTWNLCQLSTFDNIDKQDKSARIEYQIEFLDRQHAEFEDVYARCGIKHTTWSIADHIRRRDNNGNNVMQYTNYAAAKKYMNPAGDGVEFVGKYLMTARATDKAGVYGHNAVSNVRTIQQAILVRDTDAPVIYLEGSSPAINECCKSGAKGCVDWTHTMDKAIDRLDTEVLGWALPITTTYKNTQTGKSTICPLQCPAHATNKFGRAAARVNCAGLTEELARPTKGGESTQTVSYNVHDFGGNQAPTVTRSVKTVDTMCPSIHLYKKGSALCSDTADLSTCETTDKTIYHATNNCKFNAAGDHVHQDKTPFGSVNSQARQEDQCDAKSKLAISWGPREFNCRVIGDYVRTYTATDTTGNACQKTRTYQVIDPTAPSIEVEGKDLVLEATRDTEYTDAGATCSDEVDGELSHAVEVSGEVVNMRIPGTYTIQYDCQDLSGNNAKTRSRKVTVRDTTLPKLTLLGAKINYVEAGFPYIDAGATATDTLDGDVTQYIWTDGDTVDSKEAFYQANSCQQIYNMNMKARNGEYFITVELQLDSGLSTASYKRMPVHCFFSGSKGYTYHIHRAGEPAKCEKHGMIRMVRTLPTYMPIMKYVKTIYGKDFVKMIGNLDDYVCTIPERRTLLNPYLHRKNRKFVPVADAEQGKFIIVFNVEDKAGNKANHVYRTVIVKDTLPPVITLHLKNKLVHTSGTTLGANGQYSPKDHGINHKMIGGAKGKDFPTQWNPAAYPKGANGKNARGTTGAYGGFGNPYMQDGKFMAETSTTNGWLIGAVASAVAGVALLGFSARKSTVASVPV